MNNIIEFHKKNKEYSDVLFDWLTNRTKDYVDFLKRNVPNEDKCEWCEKFIAVLKFLGDYRLEDELKEKL